MLNKPLNAGVKPSHNVFMYLYIAGFNVLILCLEFTQSLQLNLVVMFSLFYNIVIRL